MTIYYCLAETTINGEVVVQDISSTYSATTSASATSEVSFYDAAKIAIAASNTVALTVGRTQVEAILVQYAYVLSDSTINEMIKNSLNTKIVQQLKGVLLEDIASAVDGKNYILNKKVVIKKNEIIQIPNGFTLKIPTDSKYINKGKVQIGGKVKGSFTTGNASYDITVPDAQGKIDNRTDFEIGTGDADDYSTLNITAAAGYEGITFINYATINNNNAGQVFVKSLKVQNRSSGPSYPGLINNNSGNLGFYIS